MNLHLRIDEIGHGVVRRTFRMGSEQVFPGRNLTIEELRAMPEPNRRAMIEKGTIVVYPKAMATAGGERFLVAAGLGKYHVVEGHLITDAPVGKREAQRIRRSRTEH